jgi:hypothetical protein
VFLFAAARAAPLLRLLPRAAAAQLLQRLHGFKTTWRVKSARSEPAQEEAREMGQKGWRVREIHTAFVSSVLRRTDQRCARETKGSFNCSLFTPLLRLCTFQLTCISFKIQLSLWPLDGKRKAAHPPGFCLLRPRCGGDDTAS